MRLQSEAGVGRLFHESLKAIRYRWPLSANARIFIVIVALLGFGAAAFICWRDATAHIEHGPLENFQAVALLLAAVVFVSGAILFRAACRTLALGLALFCFVFLMLEFDTRGLNMPMLRRLTNGMVRNIWLGGLAAIYTYVVWRNWREVAAELQRWMRDRAGLLMLISGGFWIAGAVFEHGKFFADPNVTLVLEEVVEVNAALFMAWSAVATAKFFGPKTAVERS